MLGDRASSIQITHKKLLGEQLISTIRTHQGQYFERQRFRSDTPAAEEHCSERSSFLPASSGGNCSNGYDS